MFKTSPQDDRTSAQRQSYESQESRETSTDLYYDHQSMRTSEGCLRNTARWSCVYRFHYRIKCIIPNGRLILNHFPQWWQTYHINLYFYIMLIFIREGMFFFKIDENHDAILWRSCSWRTDFVWQNYLTFNWQVHSGCQHEKSSWICLTAVLRLSCGPKKCANIAANVDMLKHWSSTIWLPYGFTISCGDHRNLAIFFSK